MIIDSITAGQPIEKGWSGDKKYCVTTTDGGKYLLRISPAEKYDRRKLEFEMMEKAARLGIPMCLPVEFGICKEGAYTVETWINGEDAERVLMTMDAERQYRYGWDAGQILAKLHTIPAPVDAPEWETRFNAKIDRKIAMYESCDLKYENGEAFLGYLAENRCLLHGRPHRGFPGTQKEPTPSPPARSKLIRTSDLHRRSSFLFYHKRSGRTRPEIPCFIKKTQGSQASTSAA